MALTVLEAVPPSSPKVVRDPEEYLPMQRVTAQIALEPAGWNAERKQRITELFDGLAPEWHTRGGEDRLRPTRDALERGLVGSGGLVVEIGSGTGIQTVPLLDKFDHVVSIDLAAGMLALSPRRDRVSLVRADAAEIPLADGSAQAIVCVNAFLFPREYARVLQQDGRIVFVSTSGSETPIYMEPELVVTAFEAAFGPVAAVTSMFEWGVWTVVARAGP
jgi:ubiquinone/menaquinone biosynthesis C-methylase UbiE